MHNFDMHRFNIALSGQKASKKSDMNIVIRDYE